MASNGGGGVKLAPKEALPSPSPRTPPPPPPPPSVPPEQPKQPLSQQKKVPPEQQKQPLPQQKKALPQQQQQPPPPQKKVPPQQQQQPPPPQKKALPQQQQQPPPPQKKALPQQQQQPPPPQKKAPPPQQQQQQQQQPPQQKKLQPQKKARPSQQQLPPPQQHLPPPQQQQPQLDKDERQPPQLPLKKPTAEEFSRVAPSEFNGVRAQNHMLENDLKSIKEELSAFMDSMRSSMTSILDRLDQLESTLDKRTIYAPANLDAGLGGSPIAGPSFRQDPMQPPPLAGGVQGSNGQHQLVYQKIHQERESVVEQSSNAKRKGKSVTIAEKDVHEKFSKTKDRRKERAPVDSIENPVPLKKRKHIKYPFVYNIGNNIQVCLKSQEMATISTKSKTVELKKGDTARDMTTRNFSAVRTEAVKSLTRLNLLQDKSRAMVLGAEKIHSDEVDMSSVDGVEKVYCIANASDNSTVVEAGAVPPTMFIGLHRLGTSGEKGMYLEDFKE